MDTQARIETFREGFDKGVASGQPYVQHLEKSLARAHEVLDTIGALVFLRDHTPQDVERHLRLKSEELATMVASAEARADEAEAILAAVGTRPTAKGDEFDATTPLVYAYADGMAWWAEHDPERKDPNWGRTCLCGVAVPAGARSTHSCTFVRRGHELGGADADE